MESNRRATLSRAFTALLATVGCAHTAPAATEDHLVAAEEPSPAQATRPVQDLRARVHNHPIRDIAFWKGAFPGALTAPLEARSRRCPDALFEYMALDNELNGYSDRPRPANLDASYLRDVEEALSNLPPAIKALLEQRVVGTCFAEGLGASAYTESIRDETGELLYGITVFDREALDRKANAWATWKERSPFSGPGTERLHAAIEEKANDTRSNAIRYIALHEFGHVIALGAKAHPDWGAASASVEGFPFAQVSWADVAGGKISSRQESQLPWRKDLGYYRFGESDITADRMVAIYADLQKTAFPSLYASTSFGDDFAESFVTYVHTVLDGRPWRVEIEADPPVVVGPCWEQPRCAKKRIELERLLQFDSAQSP